MDVLAHFLEACCVVREEAWTASAALYSAYKQWCVENGEFCLSQKALALRFAERGFRAESRSGTRGWRGVGLLSDEPAAPGELLSPEGLQVNIQRIRVAMRARGRFGGSRGSGG
jgi:phage/plasmid-associated DNA primase